MIAFLAHAMGPLLAISLRLSGLLLFAPFFSGSAISSRTKAAVLVALTALLYPTVSALVPASVLSQWPIMAIGEFALGSAFGIAANVVFDAVQMAGSVLSVQIGYSLINILDPQTEVDSTVVSVFHQTIVMLIFLRQDVHLWLLRALIRSFVYLPPGSMQIGSGLVVELVRICGVVFYIGLQIAAPVLSATLLADIALGLLGKASPQLPLLLLGPAVKSLLGLLILSATLEYWPSIFERLFLSSTESADRLLHLAR